MLDCFKEDIVTGKNRFLPDLLYALSWIFIVLCGIYALMSLQVWLYEPHAGEAIAALVGAGTAAALFFLKDNLKVEFEYTFTNGTIDFAKVYRQAKREELGSMTVKNVLACGHVAHESFSRYVSRPGIEKKNWFCNRDGNLLYFYYEKEHRPHLIVIEPSEEMVGMILKYLPAGVYQG